MLLGTERANSSCKLSWMTSFTKKRATIPVTILCVDAGSSNIDLRNSDDQVFWEVAGVEFRKSDFRVRTDCTMGLGQLHV